jgi:hypothetical protein
VVPAINVSIDFGYGSADCASRDWNGRLITLVSASLTKQTSDNGLGLMKSREVYFNVSCCHGTSTQNGTYTGRRRRIGRVNAKELWTFRHRIPLYADSAVTYIGRVESRPSSIVVLSSRGMKQASGCMYARRMTYNDDRELVSIVLLRLHFV